MAKLEIPAGLDPAVDRIEFTVHPDDPGRAYRWARVLVGMTWQVQQQPVLAAGEDWSGDVDYYELPFASWSALCGLWGMDASGQVLP